MYYVYLMTNDGGNIHNIGTRENRKYVYMKKQHKQTKHNINITNKQTQTVVKWEINWW